MRYYYPGRVREYNFALSLSKKSTQISVQHRVSIMEVIVLSTRREVSSLGESSFHLCPIWIFAFFPPHSHSNLPFFSIVFLVHVTFAII